MPRIVEGAGYRKVWLSANDTYQWAHRAGAAWPCSFLSGRRVFAEFSDGDLVDLSIDGGRGDQDCPAHELNAIMEDLGHKPAKSIWTIHPEAHGRLISNAERNRNAL